MRFHVESRRVGLRLAGVKLLAGAGKRHFATGSGYGSCQSANFRGCCLSSPRDPGRCRKARLQHSAERRVRRAPLSRHLADDILQNGEPPSWFPFGFRLQSKQGKATVCVQMSVETDTQNINSHTSPNFQAGSVRLNSSLSKRAWANKALVKRQAH